MTSHPKNFLPSDNILLLVSICESLTVSILYLQGTNLGHGIIPNGIEENYEKMLFQPSNTANLFLWTVTTVFISLSKESVVLLLFPRRKTLDGEKGKFN